MKKVYIWLATGITICLSPLSVEAQVYSGEQVEKIREMAGKDPLSTYQMGYLYEYGKFERKNERRALRMYEEAAQAGLDSAQYALGRFHQEGKVVDKNEVIARRYFDLAARQGHALAMMALAEIYEKGGTNTRKDYNKAISYYLKAWDNGIDMARNKLASLPIDAYPEQNDPIFVRYQALQGDAENEYLIGRMYQHGEGIGKDLKKAFEYYASSAKKGNSKGQLALGLMYADGLHVTKNLSLAVVHLLKAANQGESEAVNNLANYDLSNLVQNPNNTDYQLYLAKNGEASAQFNLYRKYLVGDGVSQDKEKALEYLQSAALSNYEPAIMELGRIYMDGSSPLVQQSAENSYRWYKKAAFSGNDSARYMLGQIYEEGKGVEQNIGKAVRYYLQAANNRIEMADYRLSKYDLLDYLAPNDLEYVIYQARKGSRAAQFKVGRYFLNKNSGESVFWLAKAADANHPTAQVLLGDIYLNGKVNQPKDTDKAREYFLKAADNGEVAALKALANLYAENDKDGSVQTDKAFSFANKYLEAVKKDPKEREDLHIYFVIGKIYSEKQDFTKAIQHYTTYINNFDVLNDKPAELVEALHQRSMAYIVLGNHDSALNDHEIALMELKAYNADPDIGVNGEQAKKKMGENLYQQGIDLMRKREIDASCRFILAAQKTGVEIAEEYLIICKPTQAKQP